MRSALPFTVKLAQPPEADVVVTITRQSGDADLSASPGTLTFTPANWNTPQTVRVRTRNHPDTRCVIRHTATGGGYDGVAISRVVVKIP